MHLGISTINTNYNLHLGLNKFLANTHPFLLTISVLPI